MIKWFIAVAILIVVMLISLTKLRAKTVSELNKILLIQNNPKLYLQLLENPRLKILFNQGTIEHFKLKGYMVLDDKNRIENTIDKIDHFSLSKGEKMEFNTLKLSYYAKKGKKEKSLEALNTLEKILSDAKKDESKAVLKEARQIFDVYINHNVKLIPELIEDAKLQTGQSKVICLYRAAKLEYYNNDKKEALKLLSSAKADAKGTVYQEIIENCISNLQCLEKY